MSLQWQTNQFHRFVSANSIECRQEASVRAKSENLVGNWPTLRPIYLAIWPIQKIHLKNSAGSKPITAFSNRPDCQHPLDSFLAPSVPIPTPVCQRRVSRYLPSHPLCLWKVQLFGPGILHLQVQQVVVTVVAPSLLLLTFSEVIFSLLGQQLGRNCSFVV